MRKSLHMIHNSYTSYLEDQLKNKDFQNEWRETEPEYLIAKQIIDRRLQQKLSQRELAKRISTSQSVVAHLEGMTANPTLRMLKKVADALGKKLEIKFV